LVVAGQRRAMLRGKTSSHLIPLALRCHQDPLTCTSW
jgi:hypothetical protein